MSAEFFTEIRIERQGFSAPHVMIFEMPEDRLRTLHIWLEREGIRPILVEPKHRIGRYVAMYSMPDCARIENFLEEDMKIRYIQFERTPDEIREILR